MQPTAQADTEFIAKVYEFISLTGWTQIQLAQRAGISTSVLSQYLTGKYPGDKGKVKKRLCDVIEIENKRMTTRTVNPLFIKTSVSERFFSIASMCQVFNEIGVCYADAGAGKTESAREFIARNSTSILIEADPGYTPTVLFKELHLSIGGFGTNNLHNTFNDCIERLKKSGRLLIIDEAEQLPYKSLELVRRLHDKAEIGILLTGMEKLLGNLTGFRGQYSQLYSRVGFKAKLLGLTEDDTENIVKRQIGDTDNLWKVFHRLSRGNTRRLFKGIRNAIHVSDINQCPLDANVIQTAFDMMSIEVN